MQPGWTNRAMLWMLLMESVRANRARFPTLPTAWLPHGTGNSFLLWLPELLDALDQQLQVKARCATSPTATALYQTAREICADNPAWGYYVAPSVLGYVLSHPEFNIYKGELAEIKVLGFGLDAIPHSVMAFTLSLLVQNGIVTLARQTPERSPLSKIVQRLAENPPLVSAALLTLATLIWEGGELMTQRVELNRMDGDHSAINMEWSLHDTLFDILANSLGWLAAVWTAQRSGVEGPARFDSPAMQG